MSVLVTVVEGWTKELGPFTLRNAGEPYDLTDKTIALKLRSSASSTFEDVAGDTRIGPNQSTTGKGQVFYKPDSADLRAVHSPFHMRWEVTDENGDVVYFPNTTDTDTIVVAQK